MGWEREWISSLDIGIKKFVLNWGVIYVIYVIKGSQGSFPSFSILQGNVVPTVIEPSRLIAAATTIYFYMYLTLRYHFFTAAHELSVSYYLLFIIKI